MKEQKKTTDSRSRTLLLASLVFVSFVAIAIYRPWLISLLPPVPSGGFSLLLTPIAIALLFNPLFAGSGWFFGLLALALLLALGTLKVVRPAWPLRLYLAAIAVLLVAAPVLLPVVYDEYHLYVEPDEGIELYWLTEPESRFASAFKSAQRVHERYGCTYHLLGWSAEEVLYYQSACDDRVWGFDPAIDHVPQSVTSVPATVEETEVLGRDGGNIYPPQPAGFPRNTYNHTITYETALSPGGRWQAAAIKNYYGPRDVVVLSR